MLPDRVSNPGPLTYESGALPIALRGPALINESQSVCFREKISKIIPVTSSHLKQWYCLNFSMTIYC